MKLQDLFSIEGKVALVTGGSRGIGEMIAAGFLANGAKVYICSRKADVCNATAERLSQSYGGECISIPGNIADLPGVEAVAAAIGQREETGAPPRGRERIAGAGSLRQGWADDGAGRARRDNDS